MKGKSLRLLSLVGSTGPGPSPPLQATPAAVTTVNQSTRCHLGQTQAANVPPARSVPPLGTKPRRWGPCSFCRETSTASPHHVSLPFFFKLHPIYIATNKSICFLVPTPSNIYRLLLYFSLPPYTHMPFPLKVSPPNYVYLVLLIPPHKSTRIHSPHHIHLFLLISTAERAAVDGHGRVVQEGAVVASLHSTALGDHGSEVH